MAQWEMCCIASVVWTSYPSSILYIRGNKVDIKTVLYYYTPTGVITKLPSINSWGQVIAILSAAEWEAIDIQHGLEIADNAGGVSGRVRGMYVDHPSGDKDWKYDSCSMVAYFKRPIQAGRKIDDAL